MIKQKKILSYLLSVGLLTAGTAGALSAQSNSDRSPYSRFGYGTLGMRQTATTRALGGIGAGLRDGLVVNPANPASYTAVDSMTFIMDLAVSLRGSHLAEGGNRDSRVLGNLDYATILFPVSRHIAVSAGITPFSTVGYRFGSLEKLQGDSQNNYRRTYLGQGSFSDLYLGVAGRIGGFSLGVNGSYVFGYTTQERQVYIGSEGASNPFYRTQLQLKGFKADIGAQYQLDLDQKKGRSLVVGATFAPEIKLRSTLIDQHFLSAENSSQLVPESSDTITSRSLHHVPMSYSVGATYRHSESLLVGAGFTYMQWARAIGLAQDGATPRDLYRVGLGAEWIPDPRGRGLFSRSRYRFGLSGANSYMLVPTSSGEQKGYNELTASVGIGMPLIDRRSLVNITVDYKYLTPQVTGMVREHSLGLTVGILFNENWFRKARIN